MQQADGFGDNETGGGCADEGHGDRLAGEVAPPAIIAYELPIARILTRHPHVIGGELRFLFFARVRPQIVRRARIGERVQADRVEIAGHATEAAVDDAAELRVGKVPARRIKSKPQSAELGLLVLDANAAGNSGEFYTPRPRSCASWWR